MAEQQTEASNQAAQTTFCTKYFTDEDYHDLKRLKDTANEEIQLGEEKASEKIMQVNSKELSDTMLETITEIYEASDYIKAASSLG